MMKRRKRDIERLLSEHGERQARRMEARAAQGAADEITKAQIANVLSDWEKLSVARWGANWNIAGVYRGRAHGGSREDGPSLAHDLRRIAEAEHAQDEARKPPAPADDFAEMLDAEDEEGNNDHDRGFESRPKVPDRDAMGSSDAPEVGGPADSCLGESLAGAYPGLLILPDELGAARAEVITAITAQEIDRLTAATDPSRWQTLTQAMSDYNNGARDPQTCEYANQFMTATARDAVIRAHADALRRAAFDADLPKLQAMAADVWASGP